MPDERAVPNAAIEGAERDREIRQKIRRLWNDFLWNGGWPVRPRIDYGEFSAMCDAIADFVLRDCAPLLRTPEIESAQGPVEDCPECEGRGVIVEEYETPSCPHCAGTGQVRETIRWRNLPSSPSPAVEQQVAEAMKALDDAVYSWLTATRDAERPWPLPSAAQVRDEAAKEYKAARARLTALLSASPPPPSSRRSGWPMSEQGSRGSSYKDVLEEAAAYCDEVAVEEKQRWENVRPHRYEEPAACAAALRALAGHMERIEDLTGRASFSIDYRDAFEEALSLLMPLAAGYQPTPTEDRNDG